MKGKTRITLAFLLLVGCAAVSRAQAQGVAASQSGQAGARPSEQRVPLNEAAVAFDATGREALGGRLRTTQLAGTPEAPERNTRIVIENRSAFFYNYATGWATFYDASGVRCGEGLWKLEALAPGESAEVDTPGLRLTCAPASWRIVATNLLTRTSDVAKPLDLQTTPPPQADTPAPASTAPTTNAPAQQLTPPLEINVNGKTIPIQLGNPLEITVGKERIRIVVNVAP